MSSSIRHPDFEKIHTAFLTHYSKDPKLGESRYVDWVAFSSLDETQSYYLQGAARANKSKESFEWANFLLQFVKEDKDAFYYKVEALFPVESMNKDSPPFTRDEVLQAARSLTGKPSDLNHDHKKMLDGVEVVAAQFEDDCVECLVRIFKTSVLVGMIDRKEIVNVSIEGEWSHGIPGHGLVLTGLGWLTKDTMLPGIPLTRIMPVERIAESFLAKKVLKEDVNQESAVFCVFCKTNPADYFVSICKPCFNKIVPDNPVNPEAMYNVQENLLKGLLVLPLKEAAGDLPSDFTAFKVRFVCHGANPCPNCESLNGKEFIYGTEPLVPLHDNCECGYDVVERLHIHFSKQGVEILEEKDLVEIAEKIAAKIGGKNISELEKLQTELNESGTKLKAELSDAKAKLLEIEGKVKVAEGAFVEANGKLTVANKTIEDLKKLVPGVDLLADHPVLMSVSEALADFQSLRLSPMVENCSGFSQHMGMDIRNKILKYEAKLRAK
jgi:hypothetical protein